MHLHRGDKKEGPLDPIIQERTQTQPTHRSPLASLRSKLSPGGNVDSKALYQHMEPYIEIELPPAADFHVHLRDGGVDGNSDTDNRKRRCQSCLRYGTFVDPLKRIMLIDSPIWSRQ